MSTALPVLVYENDFEGDFRGFDSANLTRELAADGTSLTQYHGDFFFDEATTLTVDLTGVDHDQVGLSFDLYLFGSWDGDATSSGPDGFSLSGDVSFATTFTNHRAEGQSYPGAPSEIYGTGSGSTHVYRGLGATASNTEFVVDHLGDAFSVTFAGSNLTDEWWGIDNVRVSVNSPVSTVPLPASAALLGAGLLGFGLIGRKSAKG